MERAIRYIRDAFFAGRQFESLDDLNAQARVWCEEVAGARRCPEDPALTVSEAWAQERSHLLALPENPYNTEEVLAVHVGKTPYVRFDMNDYSAPHTHVERTLSVRASATEVRILDDQKVIATHPRSDDKGQQIEQAEHVATLVEHKRAARHHRASDQLLKAIPECTTLLTLAAERGEPIGRTASTLMDLLQRYGVEDMRLAVADALARDVPHPNAVRLALERARHARQSPVPVGVTLPEHVKQRDRIVVPHSLAGYNNLLETDDDEH